MLADRDCRTVRAEKYLHGLSIREKQQHNQGSRHQNCINRPYTRYRTHAIPFSRTDILGSHGADSGAKRHCRHLHISPELLRSAEGGCRIDPLLIDQPHHGQHRTGNHNHLDAHWQFFGEDQPQ
ncbi:hypothetical protein D3C80_1620100 [compost metagenome]